MYFILLRPEHLTAGVFFKILRTMLRYLCNKQLLSTESL
jgi:hypothetical protein